MQQCMGWTLAKRPMSRLEEKTTQDLIREQYGSNADPVPVAMVAFRYVSMDPEIAEMFANLRHFPIVSTLT